MDISDIIKDMKNDPRNKEYTAQCLEPVLQIDPAAKILLIGQAPGKQSQANESPFSDLSGRKLSEWMGIDMDTLHSKEIGIFSMDFYFPGKAKQGDLPPRKFIADDYHKKLLSQMNNIKLTILIGNYAQKYYLGKNYKKNLTETVRNYKEYLPEYFPIVHPSPLTIGWIKKNPWFVDEVIPDLRKIVESIL